LLPLPLLPLLLLPLPLPLPLLLLLPLPLLLLLPLPLLLLLPLPLLLLPLPPAPPKMMCWRRQVGGGTITATLLQSQDYISKVIASTVSYRSECRK
jgi:hypothetical protein